MSTVAKLIYKTHNSCLPTKLPVNYYGLPDGKVYVIYSRFYEVNFERTSLEFVFALHKEFSYDYECQNLFLNDNSEELSPIYNEMVDKPEPELKILKVYRSMDSYKQALERLNKIARNMGKKSKIDSSWN